MKALKTLIRVQKNELDQLRKEMIPLEDRRDGYIERMQQLADDLQNEIRAAEEMVEMSGFFGDFSETIKKKQQETIARIERVEYQIQELNVKLSQRFADMKKYEIAYERHLEREAKQQALREQQELDEIGLRKHFYGEA
ncbi:MAG: hypothetical protein MRY32_00265 [Rickettsiales bacterium]|nr:hypothetical protein [Rickettsiales bacterium]